MAQSNRQNIYKLNSANSVEIRKLTVTVLQLLVGGLVTVGGTLFATFAVNNFSKSLGLVHLSIGLIGLVGVFIALRERSWSRAFLLGINALTIAYSAASESIVHLQSLLPSNASLGSLIGTIIAISTSAMIIYLLLGKNYRKAL